jgi:hypothetical protein
VSGADVTEESLGQGEEKEEELFVAVATVEKKVEVVSTVKTVAFAREA